LLGQQLKIIVAIVLSLLAMPALAQQLSPSQIAVALDQAIGQMAQQLEQLQKENAELKRELDQAKQQQEKK
jgi:hypothetical protein